MKTLKFKTNIKCSGCVAKVTPYLNEALGEKTWEVDYNNPSKVLTVVGEDDVVRALQRDAHSAL